MKRTKKINKIFNNKKKTSKRRFNKKGGVQEKCDICKVGFHKRGTVGAPLKSQLFGEQLFEDHILIHPICKYCNTKYLDVNNLINHIQLEHSENYNTAKKIKFGILNERNLIDELRNKNQAVVGYSPDFDLFYDTINKKTLEKKNSKHISTNVSTKPLKSDLKAEEKEIKLKKQHDESEILEQTKIALAEEQRMLREAAEKRKQEKLELQEKERIANDLIVKEQTLTLKKEKKTAKKLAKDKMTAEKETATMEAEEIISKQFNDNIKQAESVDEVIDIIENNKMKLSSAASDFIPSKKQEELKLINILTSKDFQYLPNSKWYLAIQKIFPALSGYTEIVRTNNNYINISFFIIFLMGVINFRLNAKKINLKLILKGGKSSQMLMSTYGINNTDILTDDVDILLVQEGIYDYNFLLKFANEFAVFINYFFNYQLSLLVPPNPILTNKNIVKISFVNTGLPKYIPLSDIDFKQIESEYLQGENIISSTSHWNVFEKQKNVYTYNLLFYHQSLEAFIAEKKYYLKIYENIIQKKTETEDCDCSNIHEPECSKICDYRNKMLDKFHKYINPLEEIQQTINNK